MMAFQNSVFSVVESFWLAVFKRFTGRSVFGLVFLRFYKVAYLMELDILGKTNVCTAHWSLSGICARSVRNADSPLGALRASLMGRFIRVSPVSLLIQVNCASSHMHSVLLKAISQCFRGMLRLLRGE